MFVRATRVTFEKVQSCPGCVTLVPLLTLLLIETPEVEAKNLGLAGGLFFCISEIGGFMGPFLLGALVDWTGGFLAGGYFVAALSLGILLMSFRMHSAH